ncbi:hypothetical protein PAPHI01_2497 [Pancytospora philotis]|nr:hypothetical protein PAPHI01_2497 [Pancytospora philotis]
MTAVEAYERRRINEAGTLLLFLDLQKAFDLVPYELLVAKLYLAGSGTKLGSLIENLKRRTEVRVRIGSRLSAAFLYARGIR